MSCNIDLIVTRAVLCILLLATSLDAYSRTPLPAACAELLRDLGSSEISTRITVAPSGDADTTSKQKRRMGPLAVGQTNPRYFSDPSGRSVYLTGAHTWNNLVDMDSRYPPRLFDFDAYLDFLQAHNHNLIRLWAWEVTRPNDKTDTPRRRVAAPQPWLRTGPGTDVTGLPKFDLARLDPAYFRRLRSRVSAARERDLYVIIMLFEGWSAQFSPGKQSHPFYSANNINRITALSDLRDIYTLRYPQLVGLQKKYVQAVVDNVNDFDNVLFEIVNEAGAYSTDWQYAMLRFVKCYEWTQPFQHPVGMSYQFAGGTNATLFESEADWIAPGSDSGTYLTRPDAGDGRKVIISDTDHLVGSSLSDPLWVYRSFFQGLNTLYMDRYFGPDAMNPDQGRPAPEVRAAMGHARLIATRFDMGRMFPAPGLATTGYALRGAQRMLVLAPDSARFSVDLRDMPGRLRVEWFDTVTARVTDGGFVMGGASTLIQSPFAHAAVLYLRLASVSAPAFADIQSQALAIRGVSMEYAPWLTHLWMLARPHLDQIAGHYHWLLASFFACAVAGAGLGFAVGWVSAARAARSKGQNGPVP